MEKTAEATSDLIGNKITKSSNNFSKKFQNNSDTITIGHNKEIPKERYLYLQKKYRKLLII